MRLVNMEFSEQKERATRLPPWPWTHLLFPMLIQLFRWALRAIGLRIKYPTHRLSHLVTYGTIPSCFTSGPDLG